MQIRDIVSVERGAREPLAPLFVDMEDTTILSCLQGYPGSYAFADDAGTPVCAKLVLGGHFPGSGAFGFVAGDSASPAAETLLHVRPTGHRSGCMLVPQNEDWARLIERAYPGIERLTRYALRKDEQHFDRAGLSAMAKTLPDGFEIKPIDAAMCERLRQEPWSIDMVQGYPDTECFERYGVGFICLRDGEPVGGVSAYSVYDAGVEIEIITRSEYRRRGIARACAATILIECLERGLYPSWDAANTLSLGLAESLGYVFSHEYPAYWISAEMSASDGVELPVRQS